MIHLQAFLASLSVVLYVIFKYKNQIDDNPELKWSDFWNKKWDDLVASVLAPQFLLLMYEALFSIYVWYKEDSELWGFFYDTEEGVAIIIGLFGLKIYQKLLTKGDQEIKKL